MQAAVGMGLRSRRPAIFMCILASFLTVYLYYSRSVDRNAAPVAWQPAPDAPQEEQVVEGLAGGEPGGVDAQIPLAPMSYGTSARPPFKHLKNTVADLPASLLPQPDLARPRRLVIVGDVHGMKAPLERLLDKVGFQRESGDHLILVGDLVNKGPDSAGVVELAMSLGASAVRGNNEDRVLLAHQAMRTRLVPGTDGGDGPAALGVSSRSGLLVGGDASRAGPPSSQAAGPDMLEQNPFSHGDQGDRGTAASLTASQLEWLAELPVILRLGTIRSSPFTNLVIVHAGMVPGIPLERQDPWAVMNMRTLMYPGRQARKERIRWELQKLAEQGSVSPSSAVTAQRVDAELASRRRKGQERDHGGHDDVAVPVEGRDGEQWTDAWARFQREKVARDEDRVTVVYGHDARKGLSVPSMGGTGKAAPGSTFGLDSGCVYGRRLTALVIEATSQGKIRHELVHVQCEDGRTGGNKGNGKKSRRKESP